MTQTIKKTDMGKIRRSIFIDAFVLLIVHLVLRHIQSVINDPPPNVNWEKLGAYLSYIVLIVLIRFIVAWIIPLFIGKDPIRKTIMGGWHIPLNKVIPLILVFIASVLVFTPFAETMEEMDEKRREAKIQSQEPIEEVIIDSEHFESFFAVYESNIVKFSLNGPMVDTTIEINTPDHSRLNHITFDNNRKCHGITARAIYEINLETGDSKMITSPRGLGRPAGITYDTKENRLIVSGGGGIFSYNPQNQQWDTVSSETWNDLIALAFCPDDGLIYGFKDRARYEINALYSIKEGTISKIQLSSSIMLPLYQDESENVQLIWHSNQLIAVISDAGTYSFYEINRENGKITKIKHHPTRQSSGPDSAPSALR